VGLVFVCENCGREIRKRRSAVKFTTWIRCKCGGQAYSAEKAVVKSGDHWANYESISRAVPMSDVKKWMAEDKKRGVSHLVEWVPQKSRSGKTEVAVPKFKGMRGRHAWDRAYCYYDADGVLS